MTPRVLVIPSSYFAGDRTVGGGERYAAEYARALSRLTPTTLGLFDTRAGREVSRGLETRTFRLRRLDDRLGFPLTAETLRALGEYDVLHVMIFPTPLTDLLVLQAKLRGQTVVLTDVGGGLPSWSTYLQKLHPRANLNRLADGLAHLSRHSARMFSGWRQPDVVLHGGADTHGPDLGGDAPAGDGRYALFVGRLLPHKGVLPLVQAIGPTTPLHVVGRPYDPSYLEQLRAAAAGKDVTFVLDADDAELRRQYAGAGVVLQPSLPVNPGANDTTELLGLVTLEGMAHGRPVIVTRAGSLPELVRDGETGFVVPPGDAEALRGRIEALLASRELRERMGRAARRHVASHFTWEQVARRGMSFYEQLRGGRGGAGSRQADEPTWRTGT